MSLIFNGSSNYATRASVTLTDHTVMMWAKFDVLTSYRNLFFQTNEAAGQTNVANSEYWSEPSAVTGNDTLVVGRWVHLAYTRSGSTAKVYVNGVEDASGDVGASHNLTAALDFGSWERNADWLDGCLAHVRVWNGTALTQAEIAAEMVSDTVVKSGAYAVWPLLSDLNDVSGNGRTLSFSATATYEANPTVEASAIGAATLELGGAVLKTSGGTVYVLYAVATALVMAKYSGGTWTTVSQTANGTVFSGNYSINRCHAAIDGGNTIHVVAVANNTAGTRDVSYATYNTDTDAFSSWEQAAAYTDGAGTRCSIAVDSSNKPHVAYENQVTSMGNTYYRIYYTNKTGASWLTPELVNVTTTSHHTNPRILVRNSDVVEVLYMNAGSAYIRRTRTSGSWGSETLSSTNYWEHSALLSTTGGTLYAYARRISNIVYENDSTSIAAVRTLTGTSSAALLGTTRYLFFVASTTYNIAVMSNSGSGWGSSTTLHTGSYSRVIAGWQYNANNWGTSEIGYLFDDGVSLYFDVYSLGSTFTQTFTGSLTPSGAIIRAPRKLLMAALTPAGVQLKNLSRVLTGSLSPIGTPVKTAGKVNTGFVTPAGTLATAKVAILLVLGALVPSGLLSRRTGKILQGFLAPTGAAVLNPRRILVGLLIPSGNVTKSASKVLPASLAPLGTVLRSVGKQLSGGVTPVGNVLRSALRAFLGSLSPTGAVLRGTSKVVIGTVAPVGNVLREARRVFVGTLAGVGSLSTQVSQGAQTFFVTVTGVLSPVGNVLRSVGKVTSGGVAPTGALLRTVLKTVLGAVTPVGTLWRGALKAFSGALQPAGALTRRPLKSFLGTVQPVGTLLKFTAKSISGALTPVGAALRTAGKTVSGVLTPVGVLSTQVLQGVQTFYRTFTGSLTPSGETQKVARRVLSATLLPVGSLLTRATLHFLGSLTPSSSVFKSSARAFIGSLSPFGEFTSGLTRSIWPAGSVQPSGIMVRRVSLGLSGSLAPVGNVVKRVGRVLEGVLAPVGTFLKTHFPFIVTKVSVTVIDYAVVTCTLTDAPLVAVDVEDFGVGTVDVSIILITTVTLADHAVTTVTLGDSSQ